LHPIRVKRSSINLITSYVVILYHSPKALEISDLCWIIRTVHTLLRIVFIISEGGGGWIDPFILDLFNRLRWTSRIFVITPWGIAPSTQWVGGWVGSRRGLDHVEERKILSMLAFELPPLCHPARNQSLYYERSWLRHYATGLKAIGSIPDIMEFFQLTQSFQPHYGLRVDSASNTNEYQESSWDVKRGWRLRLTISAPSVNWLSRKCGSLDVSQPSGSPLVVGGIASLPLELS
jgi:hypothetical protein